MVRKHCAKRRNYSLRAISPFLTVFTKDLYCRHVKTRAVWEKVMYSKFTLIEMKTKKVGKRTVCINISLQYNHARKFLFPDQQSSFYLFIVARMKKQTSTHISSSCTLISYLHPFPNDKFWTLPS